MNNFGLIAILVGIGLLVLPFIAPGLGDWQGADDKGMDMVSDLDQSYDPWFEPVFEPQSGAIESVLFSLQAAIGGGIIGYTLGSDSLH